jgi:transcription-repair coupling factor (superfamily II helicase)
MTELRDTELPETGPVGVPDADKPVVNLRPPKLKTFVNDFQVDTDLEIMFPDEYISNISERIRLYKELNEIETEEALAAYEQKLGDRFGKIPAPAQALMDIVRLKWIAVGLGIEKILLKNELMIANFIADPGSSFYKSPVFISIMNYVNRMQRKMTIKQKGEKLSLTVPDVKSVKAAIRVLSEMKSNTEKIE